LNFLLLGPLRVYDGAGRPVPLGRRRVERLLLGLLLLEPGRGVEVDRLVDLLWEQRPPATAVATIRSHVARLRAALDPARERGGGMLVRRGSAYVAEIDPLTVDAHRFRAAVDAAQRESSAARSAALRAALDMWRGPLLADVASPRLRDRIGTGWEELRLATLDNWVGDELAAGRHERLVPELTELVRTHPLREQLIGALMLALYRSGRQADALDAFQQVQHRLEDELGIDPGAALLDLRDSILRHDPRLDLAGPSEPASRAAPHPVPALLPPPPPQFTGRSAELATLDRLMDDRAGDSVVIAVIAGTAGVGKTTLAVRWAHTVAGRFPDGQLFVNLRGFDPTGAVTPPAAAVRVFLAALGVTDLPADLDAQFGLYRSLVARRRLLVVLDNARDAEQVRPLLPCSPGSLVVVTSRRQLPGLVATDGARPVPLSLLRTEESRLLLAHRLDAERLAAAPAAVDAIVARCAGLPLALAVVAANALTRPDTTLATLASELTSADPLRTLGGDDTATDVRQVFSWSYRSLRPAAAGLFRLLGIHQAADLGLPAVASLGALDTVEARAHLTELCEASLVTVAGPDRYTMHDLLRGYAMAVARETDPPPLLAQARLRLVDHYLQSAVAADRGLYSHRTPIDIAAPLAGVTVVAPDDHDAALAWFDEERHVFPAIVELAMRIGAWTPAWQLPWALALFHDRRSLWHDLLAVHTRALEAAGRLDDDGARAHARRGLARALNPMGRHEEAQAHLEEALRLHRRCGDDLSLANTHLALAVVFNHKGCYRDGLAETVQALEHFRGADDKHGLAVALNATGWYHAQLGEHEQAITYCEQALHLLQAEGDRLSTAATWDSIGHAQHRLGRHEQALASYRRAISLFTETGDRYNAADVTVHLGDLYADSGDPTLARETWLAALSTLEEIGHAQAASVRERIERVASAP
jgi:DNA-binding SARP family transcriptional activator/tetratricopeptide (TPR) repeat protein